MIEKNANVKGFLLYNPFAKTYFFRIYHGNGKFTDYDLRTEEIEIEIIGDSLSLYESDEQNYLGWATKVLKPQPGQKVQKVSRRNGKRVVVTGYYDENLQFVPEHEQTHPIDDAQIDQ